MRIEKLSGREQASIRQPVPLPARHEGLLRKTVRLERELGRPAQCGDKRSLGGRVNRALAEIRLEAVAAQRCLRGCGRGGLEAVNDLELDDLFRQTFQRGAELARDIHLVGQIVYAGRSP